MKEKIINFCKKNEVACELVLAMFLSLGVLKMCDMLFSENFFLMFLIFVAIFAIVRLGFKNLNKRRLIYSFMFALPFGLCFWLGSEVVVFEDTTLNPITLLSVLVLLVVIVIFTLVSTTLFAFMDGHSIFRKQKQQLGKRQWIKYAAVMFLCWLPLFLIFFPGFISVDSAVQIQQAIGEGVLSNWHPVLHTAFIAFFVKIGEVLFNSLTIGIALYTIAQMVIMALIYGYIVKWSIEQTSKKWVGYILLLFFAFCPTVSCYSITMWKDILFSSFFVLLIVRICNFLQKYKVSQNIPVKDIIGLTILAILVAFLRNGGVLILIAFGIGLCVYYYGSWKKIGLISLGAIAITLIIQGPIYNALNIASSPFMESMSVPAQQFGYVAQSGTLSEEESGMLSEFVDVQKLATDYTPMNADPAKNSFYYDEVEADKISFVGVWFKIFTNHIGDFFKAYMLQMYSYWYIQSDAWVLDINHVHDEKWLQAEYKDLALMGEDARIYVEKIENGLTNSVFWGWTNNVGVVFWGIIYILMVFLYQKRYKMLVPMACVVVYMVSLLIASPVSWIFRYVYSLMLILPIFIIIVFQKNKR